MRASDGIWWEIEVFLWALSNFPTARFCSRKGETKEGEIGSDFWRRRKPTSSRGNLSRGFEEKWAFAPKKARGRRGTQKCPREPEGRGEGGGPRGIFKLVGEYTCPAFPTRDQTLLPVFLSSQPRSFSHNSRAMLQDHLSIQFCQPLNIRLIKYAQKNSREFLIATRATALVSTFSLSLSISTEFVHARREGGHPPLSLPAPSRPRPAHWYPAGDPPPKKKSFSRANGISVSRSSRKICRVFPVSLWANDVSRIIERELRKKPVF